MLRLWHRSPLSCLGWWPLLRWALDWDGKGFLLDCLAASVCLQTGLLFPPNEGPRCPALLWGGKRRAVRWATQRAALGDAACCDGTCSALRHLTRNAALWRVLLKVGACTRLPVRHGALLYWSPNAAGIPAFAPSEYRSGRLLPLSPCRVPTAGVGWRGAAAALGMSEKESMAYALGRCHASLRLGYPVSNQN